MSHPTQLGKYPITGVIGEGAMGVVYKAYDPVIERPVAIKTVHRQLMGGDDSGSSYASRFRNEAQAVGRLSHPGIVAIYEYGEDKDTAFIAMEYVEGSTLSQLLATTPMPKETTIVRVMDQLLDALDCAHRAGVWHRDIKPANIIITPKGQLKVTDFGIARIENNALTLVTSVIGTPGYIAPEQYMGLPLDHRIDVFAAGVLMYRMLTGNSPFAGTPEAVMYKTVNELPSPPSRIEGIRRSPAFDEVVAKALAKKPQDRYASAAEFRQAVLQAGGITTRPAANETQAIADLPTEPLAPLSAQPSTLPSGGTLLGASSIGGWDANELAPVELALAKVIGPMARLMVRQAARSCTDMASLVARVADGIADQKERAAFLARTARLPARERTPITAAPTGATTTTTPPLTDPGGPLPSAVIGHALKVLTRHMGPIARIVIKKAAVQVATPEEFYELLSNEVAEPADRARLLAQLRSIPPA